MEKADKINNSIFKIVYGAPENPFDVVKTFDEEDPSLFECEIVNGKVQVKGEGKIIAHEISSSLDNGIFSVTFSSYDSHFFGFGEKMGFLDKKGKTFKMQNTDTPLHTPDLDPMYISIPFFIILSPKKPAVGIFVNSTSYSSFKMNEYDYTLSVKDNGMELYIIYGPKIQNVIEKFTHLVGRMEMPPAWALGYQQSRWSYFTSDEALNVAKKMREDSIPCDVIYLDIDYMDGYRVFTWGKNFKDPKKFSDEMKKMGFKIVTIIDPGVKKDENYEIYRSGKSLDAFAKDVNGEDFTGYVWPGKCDFPDFLRTDVRDWWAKSHKNLFENGVDGIWNDMNEPAIVWTDSKTSKANELLKRGEIDFQILGEVKELFNQGDFGDEIFHKDDNGRSWPHYKVRNIYAYLEAMATEKAFEMYRPNKRPFILTRAGFAGIQKYAAVWTGDNSSWWEHLEGEMPISMGLGLSGVPFTGADVGGFGGNANGELLARWTEMGAFFPFFRNHSAIGTVQQEPWAFGKKTEDIIRKYINLRYEMFPYLYTTFYFAHLNGTPVMRPLLFTDQDNEALYSVNDEFLLGDSILVAPITKPNSDWRAVYIPKGRWIDIRNGNIYEENQLYKINAPIDEIPIFVKENSVIFRTDPSNYIFEKEKANLYIDLYGHKAIGYLYEDDGETIDYKSGKYNLYRFSIDNSIQGYDVKIETLNKGYSGRYEKVHVNFKSTNEKAVRITVNGKETEAHFDGEILKVEFEMKDVI